MSLEMMEVSETKSALPVVKRRLMKEAMPSPFKTGGRNAFIANGRKARLVCPGNRIGMVSAELHMGTVNKNPRRQAAIVSLTTDFSSLAAKIRCAKEGSQE